MEEKKDKNELVDGSINQNRLISGDFDPSHFFRKDKNFTFAHQKIKKLVAAVYMITNYFDQNEPLKWSLRKLGMDILRLNIDFKDMSLHGAESGENAIRERALELVSLLEVASFAGLVSSMNLSILKKEFNDLLEHIHKTLKDGERTGIRMDETFFSVIPGPVDKHVDESQYETIQSSDRHIGRTVQDNKVFYTEVVQPMQESQSIRNVSNSFSSTPQQNKAVLEGQSEKKEILRDFSPVAVKKNKRQSIIINLLKRKKEVMIKDISSLISDCSEKTIQRELFALVDAGILKKEGERRWTRYSLAGQQ